jgi:metal-sulfur cluster biosynthetic enzyme
MDIQSIELKHEVVEHLKQVIDPETGVNVIRMRLVEDLKVEAKTGHVSYKFRPSSPLCPLAVYLAQEIQKAVAETPGVVDQDIEVVGYVGADELNALLRQ